MGKYTTGHRTRIHAQRIEREEFRLCNSDGCRNAIALWFHNTFCSRCRKKAER